jgi:hypothetical protein
MLPELAEILLPHIDAAVESASDTLMVFSIFFENMPSLPLSQPLQLPAGLHVNAAASEVIASINSFFTRPGAFQTSFCARFFDKIMSFCLQADQPDEQVNMGMGSKREETGTPYVAFQACVECFIAHLPLRSELSASDVDVFSFDDALHALLDHCRSNSALHLPVHTFGLVSACMSAHSEATARLFVPFLMDQLLRPVVAATPTATPLPVRRNRVVGNRNERILRYFAGILHTVLFGVNTNSTRTFLLEFVPQIYDLDRFLLATRLRSSAASPAASPNTSKKQRAQNLSEPTSEAEAKPTIIGVTNREKKKRSSAISEGTASDGNKHEHQLKHLSSDGCDLVQSLLRCFSAPTLLPRSPLVSAFVWHEPKWRAAHFVSWGRGVDPESAQVTFETPTRAHLNCAAAIFRRLAIAPLNGLLDIANGVSRVEYDGLSEYSTPIHVACNSSTLSSFF